jgi:chromosome segregation ATPase
MFGGGWHAGWNVHIPQVIPQHLRVEPYERAVLEAQGAAVRAQRALELAAAAQERTQISERDFQTRLWGAEASAPSSGKRRKGVPSGHHTAAGIAMLKTQLSTASVNRRAAEFRFEGAERELERAQQNVAVLRGDLDERRAALEQWRQQHQAQQQAAEEERRRLMEVEMQRHVQQQRQANEARVRELREARERMVAQPRVQQRVRVMVVPRRQPVRAPAKTPPKTRKKR